MTYYNFADEGSVPTTFDEIEGGSGAVSITSDHLRITNGSTGTGDYACAVWNTALDQSKLWVIMAEVKMSGTVGAWVPNIVGLMDSSGTPAAMTVSTRNSNNRIWQEYQMSSGADNFDRIQLKVKNPSGTQYNYVASSDSWTSSFTYTRAYYDEDSYYRFIIVYDGTQATKRARSLVYGYTEGFYKNWNLNYDSSWRDFDTGTTDIDPFDNSMWAYFGDPINDQTKSVTTFDYRRIMVAAIDETDTSQFAWTNNGDTTEYDIFAYLNPHPDEQSLWIPREQNDTSAAIAASGTEDWVKDPYVYYDGTTYWMFYQAKISATGLSHLYVRSTTDILDNSWSSATLISSPDTGERKHEFPWATKYSGTWYLLYGVEFTSPTTWEIQYKTTTATNPTSGWSSATTLYDPGGGADWQDDGATQPFPIWYSGGFTDGTWYMVYAGYNGTTWQGGLAKSTTGITGTYTSDAGNPVFAVDTTTTQIDGTMTDVAQITVDSTTGFAAGMTIFFSDTANARGPAEILSVDSGTTMTLAQEWTGAINTNVYPYNYHSWAPRTARYVNGYWHIYGTPFKFAGGYEAVSLYIGTTGELDLANETFRQARTGDTAIDYIIPVIPLTETSCENIGLVWEELSVLVETSPGFMTTNTGYWGT